jgi:hypothetical protein
MPFYHQKRPILYPDEKPSRRGVKAATNRLSYGTPYFSLKEDRDIK